MDNREFDKLLREKFKQDRLHQKPERWEQFSQHLPVSKEKTFLPIFWKMAAAAVLLIGLGVGLTFIFKDNNSTPDINQNIAQNNTDSAPIVPKKENTQSNSGKENNSTAAKPSKEKHNPFTPLITPASQQKAKINHDIASANNKNRSNNAVNIPVTTQNKNQAKSPNLFNHQDFEENPRNNAPKLKDKREKSNLYAKDNSNSSESSLLRINHGNSGYHSMPSKDLNVYSKNYTTKSANASMAVGGGLKYGALNMGYALNVSGQHPIGSNFFVGGSVAFQYNNQATNVKTFSAPDIKTLGKNTGIPNLHPIATPVSNFYYLDVNPTLGYDINQIVAFSIGPDIQQKINGTPENHKAIYTPQTNPRIVPKLDVGVSGEIEFHITPNLQAGLLYRDGGLNNVLKTKDVHPYLNRRYVQLQLKYNFLFN